MKNPSLHERTCSKLDGKIQYDVLEPPKKMNGFYRDSSIQTNSSEARVLAILGKPKIRNVKGCGEKWKRNVFYYSGEFPYKERVCIETPGVIRE